MRLGCLVLLTAVSLGTGCTSSPFDGDWHVTRTFTWQSDGCDPVEARAIDISVDSTRERPVAGSAVADSEIVNDEVVFDTDEAAYVGDSNSIILGYHLHTADDNGDSLTGVVLAEGDQGPNSGCIYGFDARATRTR